MTKAEKIKSNEKMIEEIYISYTQAKRIGDVWGARMFDKNMARLEKENDKLLKELNNVKK
jgi:hypothetical protein